METQTSSQTVLEEIAYQEKSESVKCGYCGKSLSIYGAYQHHKPTPEHPFEGNYYCSFNHFNLFTED